MKIATTNEIDALIASGSPVAIGVSGGKDSSAVAFATIEHLNRVGHKGPRILIHSDLGVTEWKESLPTCERLADRLGTELVVVRRAKGDMMERWEQRWSDNVARYASLQCVKLILPWSTPGMRFCTSEMKTAPICQELVRRFPCQRIISVTGIRREESSGRKNAPVTKPQPKLTSVGKKTSGLDWHPIPDWTLSEVLEYLERRNFPLHEAYTTYGMSRVSCAFCIMSNAADRLAATTCVDNHPLYRRMVSLEVKSTFAFQGENWLGDVAPHLLDSDTRIGLDWAKRHGRVREEAEIAIPSHLLYAKGWPTCVPTREEAKMLCDVRQRVAACVGLEIEYSDVDSLISRYEELYAANRN